MMQHDSGRPFTYDFTNDSSYSYLVLELYDDTRLLNYQAEIISQNPCPAFAAFHIRRVNELVSIYYNITSKITLSEYLKRKCLNKKELLDILKSINKALLQHSNYLLDLSGFLLDKDFIFINPATAEASLVYVPVVWEGDALEDYKSFLKDIIVNSASIDDNEKDNYIHRILSYLKLEAFTLSGFNNLITSLRNSEPGFAHREIAAALESSAAVDLPTRPKAVDMPNIKADENRRQPGVIMVHLLIFLAAAIGCLLMAYLGKADAVSIIGILVIAAAVDMYIMSKMPGKPEKQLNKAEPENTKYKPSEAPKAFKALNTVLVSNDSVQDCPYLEGIGANRGERIPINKDRFVIGRLDSMVDYVMAGSTIGKLHAEITCVGGVYRIRDLNSKNGTYINDVRIPSNKECEIKNDDRIRLSCNEYIFRQQL